MVNRGMVESAQNKTLRITRIYQSCPACTFRCRSKVGIIACTQSYRGQIKNLIFFASQDHYTPLRIGQTPAEGQAVLIVSSPLHPGNYRSCFQTMPRDRKSVV